MSNIFDVKDWVQIGSTIILSIVALSAPYISEKLKHTYKKPKLKIKFKLSPPDCHLTKTSSNVLVYYFRFIVTNYGKTYAEDCEVFLEEIYKKNNNGSYIKYKNFSAVNLKWSGIGDNFNRTIYPDKETYCDIGRIYDKDNIYKSLYFGISEHDQARNKFAFELPGGILFSQWDCLVPGEYKIRISVYSKNSEKVTQYFYIYWSGCWKSTEEDMFKELVVKLV